MLPIIWRFLIREYLKVFFLCLFSFIILLVVIRFDEIAKIATIGASFRHICLFIFYQIPYILPLAIPLSALVSSLLLFGRLSDSHELPALQSSGLSFFTILLPLVCVSAFLSLANFVIVSEIATSAHLSGRKMLYELTAQNPLILLQNARITPLKQAYVQFSPEHNGKEAKNLLIAWSNESEQNLNMALAKKIKIKNSQLIGKNITLISSCLNPSENYLMVENQEEVHTASFECAQFLYDKGWKMANDHLRYSLLSIRLKKLKDQRGNASYADEKIQKMINKCYSEKLRRFSLGCAPLSFMFLGASLGIKQKRSVSKKKILAGTLLTALALILFLIAKEFQQYIVLSSLLFILPHIIFLSASIFIMYMLKRGS